LSLRGIDNTSTDANNITIQNNIILSTAGSGVGGLIQFGGGYNSNGFTFNQNYVVQNNSGGNGYVLYAGNAMNNGTISNNYINASGFAFGPDPAPANPTGWVIEGNEFNGNLAGQGDYAGYGFNSQFGNVVIQNNYAHKMYIGLGQVSVVGGTISGNTFYDNQFAAFQLWGTEYSSLVSSNVTIQNNLIAYNGVACTSAADASHGIRLRIGLDPTTIHLNYNYFQDLGVGTCGQAWAIRNSASPMLADATNNWWGQSTGPTAAQTDGFETVIPYITAYTPDPAKAMDLGFWPLFVSMIWNNSTVPKVVDNGADSPVELGVKFTASVSGTITGIRFYKSANNTGTHIGNLWDSSGNNLASATFTSETASGWQQVTFTTPVAITADTTYVASYHTTVGHYSADQNFFTAAVNNPPLQFPAGPGNGVYRYGTSAFPNNSYNSTNYWVDVMFEAGATVTPPSCTTTTPCMIWNNSTAPKVADNGPDSPVELGVRFTSSVGGMITGIRFYKSGNNTGTHIGNLWDSSGNNLATATFTSETASGWQQVIFTTPVNINATTVYVASYHTTVGHYSADQNFFTTAVNNPPLQFLAGPGNGVYKYGGSAFPNNSFNSTNYWVDVLFAAGAAPPPSCTTSPCTIWSNTTTPTVADNGADLPVELGVQFTSSEGGTITGIRFYKSANNTGLHTGTLWSSAGAQLATGTFTGETASGWQQVTFATPVAITANTTYVASYHATVGHYSADQNFFATTGVNNPPLQALAGNNGVYVYGNGGVFPSKSYNSTNYWVDVVFQLP